ncbi:MAG: hypothetical protein EOM32_00065 [Spirochaetia bacterium]|uniref:hypothetical protein n=1 Tax=Sphaerochaeta sp. TaxID=1972642 RepID=UPI001DB1ED98|nr:hypothetical protein [uncultured Sphaerochaeta sp.]MDD3057047.1 hypothetical protein [Sphaerochaeta sp.]NCC11742.1 hypothetical protein [Spirochaetia bacterium]NCC90419.1 hypothetical protein [Spirochaetia bacterium]
MITCYFLQRSNKENICLSPYLDTERVDSWEEGESVQLLSSGMLTKPQRDEATYALYSAIDFCVDRWIQNKQYVPRLLVTALIFTASYFFFSLVIRDPLPMLDELAISFGLGIFGWSVLAKRDTRSSVAQRRRYEMKVRSSEREEVVQEHLFALETYLDEVAALDPLDLAKALCLVDSGTLKDLPYDGDDSMLADITSSMMLYLSVNNKPLRKLAERIHHQRAMGKPDENLSARLFHQSMQKRLDLSLLALVVVLLES